MPASMHRRRSLALECEPEKEEGAKGGIRREKDVMGK
jgi:hypothetical protein